MDPTLFDALHSTLRDAGPAAAIDRLCRDLQDRKEYGPLFYALLMKTRHELGLSPVATGGNQDLPPAAQEPFEDGIRRAARTVGGLYLQDGNIPQAWAYFRMLGEPEPVARALETAEPGDDDAQALIDIAFQQGVLPVKGFDWVLERYGLCNAITTLSGGELPFPPEVRQACVKRQPPAKSLISLCCKPRQATAYFVRAPGVGRRSLMRRSG